MEILRVRYGDRNKKQKKLEERRGGGKGTGIE
jgi:hypothetical protein